MVQVNVGSHMLGRRGCVAPVPGSALGGKDLRTEAVLATSFLLAGHQFADIVPKQQERS